MPPTILFPYFHTCICVHIKNGSGKTLVLCHRILHLVSQGIAAKDILAVTFSRRAGQELLRKLHTAAASYHINALLKGIQVRTFHSFCLTILRAFPSQAGLSPDFSVLTPKMQLRILEDLIRSWYDVKLAQGNGEGSRTASNSIDFVESHRRKLFRSEAHRLQQQLQRLQNTKKSRNGVDDKKINPYRAGELFEWVYDKYHTALASVNAIDFNDFSRLASKVLETCEHTLASIGLQAHYILAAKSNGFKSLLQQKVARQSLRENYKSLSQSDNNRTQCTYMKKLQSFLDYVYLKLHDGELGTFGALSTSLPEDSQCSDEGMSLDSIVLSTVHQAKGLEWTAVILARVNEGVLPVIDCEASVERIVPQAIDSGFCLDPEKRRLSCGGSYEHAESLVKVDDVSKEFTENRTQGVVTVLTDGHTSTLGENMTNSTLEALEEERRLMYVALTRAKFFLLITHVMLHGQQSMLPSRFLAEIPKGLMHRTTCYESNSVELRDDTTPQAVDGRSPKAVVDGKRLKASKSGRLSRIGGPQDAEVSVKDNQVVATSMLLGKKRACNMISKNTVNIEESLTEIDEALEGMIDSKKLRDIQKGKQDRTKGKRRRLYSGSRSKESCSDELDVQAISARGNAKT